MPPYVCIFKALSEILSLVGFSCHLPCSVNISTSVYMTEPCLAALIGKVEMTVGRESLEGFLEEVLDGLQNVGEE